MRDGAGSVVSGGSSKARSKASRKSKSSKSSKVPAPTIEGFMLEVYGEDFKKAMLPLLRDNSTVLTKAPNSFRGDEAVDTLLEIIKDHADEDEEVKQSFAIQVGRALASNLKLFVNVNHEKKLLEHNKNDIYVFKNNLPIQVHKAKKNYPSLWDRVKLLETHLEVKDRKTLMQTQTDCFVGKEAVNCIMDSNLAVSREEAVSLLNRMNETVKFCKHATNPKADIMDKKDQFYRFTPASVRTPESWLLFL